MGHDSRRGYRVGRSVVAAATAALCTVAVAPASAAVDAFPAPSHSSLPIIRGVVGPDFVISINQDTVPAGRYKLIVRDRGTIHNFHFFGPGVDRRTRVAGTGKWVWRVELSRGTYTAACVPHGSMSTKLTVV